jgi:hypothetical protein
VAAGNSELQVIDVSDPARPTRVKHVTTRWYARAVTVSGARAYVALLHEGVQVFDISNPAEPLRLEVYDTGGDALGVAISGKHAFVAAERSGLKVIDVSDPPLSLTSLPAVSGRQIHRLSLSGPSGVSVRVQRSENLIEWQDWQTIKLRNRPAEVEDPDVANQAQRFYRAVGTMRASISRGAH